MLLFFDLHICFTSSFSSSDNPNPKIIPKNMLKEIILEEEKLSENDLIIQIKKELSFSSKNGNN